jgi:hypothetical protein
MIPLLFASVVASLVFVTLAWRHGLAVVAHVILRGVSKEQYDRVRAEVGWLERAPEGGISHVTWWKGDDCHNIDARRARPRSRSSDRTDWAPAYVVQDLM